MMATASALPQLDGGCAPAYERITAEDLALVRTAANILSRRLPMHVELDDLISEGYLGLLRAAELFDPARNASFVTFAKIKINGAMLDWIRLQDWAPRSLRKKQREIDQARAALEQDLFRPAMPEEIAHELGETIEAYYRSDLEISRSVPMRLDVLIDAERDDSISGSRDSCNHVVILSCPPVQTSALEREDLRVGIAGAINCLPCKARLVLSLYYFEELSQDEIGELLGVNGSRVCQLLAKARLHLRKRLILNGITGCDALSL